MGSRAGVEQAAAARIGYSLTEYLDNLNRGLLWCHKDQAWEPAEDFGVDRSRGRGRASSCRRSRNAASRARYVPKDRPTPGRRFVAARDDDRKQARRRVNHLIDAELLPAPSTLPCADCGQVWEPGKPRHEYDHHLGYAAEHHEDVEAVCSPCHHAREKARGES